MRLFAPSWRKFDAEPVGFRQFNYLSDKNVSPEWGRAGYSGLNEGRKMAVRFYWFTAELNNGGLPQYFWNSSGAFTAEQIADFQRIGCPKAASVLAAAAQKIFGTTSPPVDTAERRQQIDSYYGTHPFNDDDDQERLTPLQDKDDLRQESNQLASLQKEIAVALCTWFRANPQYFTRLR